MQVFKFNYVFVVLLFCVSLLSCTPKNAESSSSEENSSQNTETPTTENTESTQNKEGNYTYSYKLGAEPKVEDKGENFSVSLVKKGAGKKGQEKYNTKLEFKVIYQNRMSLSFDVVNEAVLEKMDRQYSFTSYEKARQGDVKIDNFMAVMIVDAKAESGPFASSEVSMVNVNFDGTNLKVSIKGATVTAMQDDEVTIPFEFELDAKNVEVTKYGF